MMRNAMDPERLAALLDGRLKGDERDALIAELAASDDDTLHAYADAAAVSLELNPEIAAPVQADDLSQRRLRSRRRAWRVGGLALAAGLVLAVGVPLIYGRARHVRDDSPVEDLRIPPSGLPALPWGATRGVSDALPASSRAFRVGAMIANLELQSRANAATSAPTADAISADLIDVPGGAPAAALYKQIGIAARGGRAASAEELNAASDAAGGVLDASLVTLGAWLQGARVAAVEARSAFFASELSQRMLTQLGAMYGAGPARATLDRLQSELRAPAPDWTACEQLLTTLLEASGR